MNLETSKQAIIAVGDGRGFIVQAHNLRSEHVIITAGHCLPHMPPSVPSSYTEERTYENLLGPLGRERSIWAECLFVDPVSDIAVLSGPDSQEWDKQAEEYEALVENCLPGIQAGLSPNSKCPGWLLSLENELVPCQIRRRSHAIQVTDVPTEIVGGMSGSFILNENGEAVGVLCMSTGSSPEGHTSGLLQPCLAETLPNRIWQELVQISPQ